jgi:DNA-directed RNA polymerase specialized sigma24 family protein
VPVDVEETDGSVEDWLSRQVSELPNSDVEAAATRREILEILQETKLPLDVINIILLKCDGLTYDKIAKTIGLTKDAIRMKLNRAKPDIAAVLAKI